MKIKALVLDFDGVLTDGGTWWGPDGAEWKRLSFHDIMGISIAIKSGLLVAVISGESGELLERFAAKMHLTEMVQGCKDKDGALRSFAARNGLDVEEICYMGDDVNDLPAMRVAGFSAAPADARPDVRAVVNVVTTANGGNGAVRELVDASLSGDHA